MPRAFCPECGSEVPVDADGVCHVGHLVELAGASAGPGGDLDAVAPPTPEEPDEPQPWVANVDETTLGGSTPPPGGAEVPPPDSPMTAEPAERAAPDGAAWTPGDAAPGSEPDEATGDRGVDDLAAAAAAAVESLGSDADDDAPWTAQVPAAEPGPDPVEGQGQQVEAAWPQTLPSEGDAPGWTPPTNDPVAPPPVPAPAPAEPPAPGASTGTDGMGAGSDLDAGDFDLDDLAAAVSELGLDEPTPAPTAGATPAPTPPAGTEPDPEDDGDGSGGHADGAGDPADTGDAEADAPADGDAVDLSNFTAKGGKVRDGGGKRGGLFRRR